MILLWKPCIPTVGILNATQEKNKVARQQQNQISDAFRLVWKIDNMAQGVDLRLKTNQFESFNCSNLTSHFVEILCFYFVEYKHHGEFSNHSYSTILPPPSRQKCENEGGGKNF